MDPTDLGEAVEVLLLATLVTVLNVAAGAIPPWVFSWTISGVCIAWAWVDSEVRP